MYTRKQMRASKRITTKLYEDRKAILTNLLAQQRFINRADPHLAGLIMSYVRDDDTVLVKYGTPFNVADIVKDGILVVDLEYKICDEIDILPTGTHISKVNIENGEVFLKVKKSRHYYSVPVVK